MPVPKSRSRSSTSSPPAARLDDFARFCSELRVEDGSAFRLWPFQRLLLEGYFAGVLELCIILPKKNGKSTLLAALALFHLLTVPNAECIIVAASRDQAGLILRQARMFIRGNADLSRVMGISQRQILSKLDEGRIVVLASDEDTADGYIPTLAIVDELHRHKTADLYGVLRDGLGPRDGQIITISTAAATRDSPLGKVRALAHELPTFVREGKRNHATAEGFEFWEWCLDPTDETENLEVVKEANPAPWNTIAKLRSRRRSPHMTESQWLRFGCGIWTESEDPWLEPSTFDALADPKLSIAKGSEVVLAVKVKGVSAAIVAVRVAKTVDAWALVWDRPAELSDVEAKLRELCARWTVSKVLFDPYSFKRSAELLETEGLPMFEFANSLERMSQASGSLQRAVENRELRWTGDPAFRAHVLAGVWKESERGRRLNEDPQTHRPIEALIALASAVHVAGAPKKNREVMVAWR